MSANDTVLVAPRPLRLSSFSSFSRSSQRLVQSTSTSDDKSVLPDPADSAPPSGRDSASPRTSPRYILSLRRSAESNFQLTPCDCSDLVYLLTPLKNSCLFFAQHCSHRLPPHSALVAMDPPRTLHRPSCMFISSYHIIPAFSHRLHLARWTLRTLTLQGRRQRHLLPLSPRVISLFQIPGRGVFQAS